MQILAEDRAIEVPEWVTDIESFRRWTDTADCPHEYKMGWLKGKVWIDVSREQVFTHLEVKLMYYIRLGQLVRDNDLGLFISDGLLLSNFAADISGNPDGTFISHEMLLSDRIRLLEGSRGGSTEIQGSPDMVLEVVSASSVEKDYELLRRANWEADIREYWLVHARKDPPKFDILRHTPRGYVATRKQGGWIKSAVFGKSFQLSRRTNDLSHHPQFTLSIR